MYDHGTTSNKDLPNPNKKRCPPEPKEDTLPFTIRQLAGMAHTAAASAAVKHFSPCNFVTLFFNRCTFSFAILYSLLVSDFNGRLRTFAGFPARARTIILRVRKDLSRTMSNNVCYLSLLYITFHHYCQADGNPPLICQKMSFLSIFEVVDQVAWTSVEMVFAPIGFLVSVGGIA